MRVKGKWIFIVCLVLLAICIAWFSMSFGNQPVNKEAIEQQAKRIHNAYNIRLTDSAIHLLQSGDIVVRTGADITSYMFTQMNLRDKTYSHCGLVSVEDGYPFVYHSIGGEDNPNQELRRDPANFWFSPANNLGFGLVRLDIDSDSRESILETVKVFYREKRKFDMDFDLKTDDRLYCAEFVYKVLNKAMKDSDFIKPSVMFGYTFVAVDNLFLNSHARFICQVRFK